MNELQESRLKEIVKTVDCKNCPLRNENFRCALNVGCISPIDCETLLIKWLMGEYIPNYWEEKEFQESELYKRVYKRLTNVEDLILEQTEQM